MRKTLALLSTLSLAAITSAHAATVYWDINGVTAGSGSGAPAGNWGTGSATWGNNLGTAATANWVDGDSAVLAAGTDATGSYTITVNTPITVASILREEGSPTISATSANLLTFASGALSVDTGTGTLIVNAFYAPANGVVTKAGTGILSPGTSQTSFAGKWICNAGTLSFAGDTRIGIVPGAADQITLNGGRIRSSTASVVFDASRGVVLGASGGGFNQTTTTPLTWNGVISGSGALTLDGATTAITVLAGNNTYAGNTIVTLGTLQSGASEVIPDTSLVTLASGTTLSLVSFTETVRSVSGAGAINLGTGRLVINAPAAESLTGVISGTTGGITKNGSGTWTMGAASAANTFTGSTTNNGGILILNNASSGRFNIPGDLVINPGRRSRKLALAI